MKHIIYLSILFFALTFASSAQKVQFKNDTANRKVDVYFGDSYFTSYIYPEDMEKQVLYPIVTASGKEITRGYPINPRPFERTDHPHHVGLWLNFGDVNGLDFWNNSFAVKAEDKYRYGAIKFKEVVDANSKTGTLVTASDWVNIDNETLLNERTTFVFGEKKGVRTIDRTSELTARQEVTFTENKEGLLGLRMDRAFEEPADKAGRFLDAEGNITEVPVLNNDGVNGVYRNAEGFTAGDVWGKRSPWVALRAEKEGEVITVVILDHPDNPNYPAWSHARGYGLFASNNFGGRAIDKNANPVKLTLKPGEKLVLKHLVVIGGDLTDEQISRIKKSFK
ncbi:Methane oxygenase PmoA [Mariniphaga anaerophila]|uniref:Methane oxygenase PmoA n=1 Tax=Mariniphaga anaerophila TaxID=1484053 RepID=A0A1M4Y578_9BACT|nr:PmoA family protein [Mariniphaga anaerophila]SHF00830.1 Methane oxygenase PmoA [Mariniphaga anaerophila]